MFCHQCGTENSESAKFCKKCGIQLKKPSVQSNQAPSPLVVDKNILPECAKKWSWGAFGLGMIWKLGNDVPFFKGFFWGLGTHGRQWSWETGRWKSVEEFEAAQKKWDTWGIVVFATVLILVTIAKLNK